LKIQRKCLVWSKVFDKNTLFLQSSYIIHKKKWSIKCDKLYNITYLKPLSNFHSDSGLKILASFCQRDFLWLNENLLHTFLSPNLPKNIAVSRLLSTSFFWALHFASFILGLKSSFKDVNDSLSMVGTPKKWLDLSRISSVSMGGFLVAKKKVLHVTFLLK